MGKGVLGAIDDARRDLQIAAEYKGMPTANKSADSLIAARMALEDLIIEMPSLLGLYRMKWGNMNDDASAVHDRARAAFDRVMGHL